MTPSQVFAKDVDGHQYQFIEGDWQPRQDSPDFWEELWSEGEEVDLDGIDTTKPFIAYLLEGEWSCLNVAHPLIDEPWND